MNVGVKLSDIKIVRTLPCDFVRFKISQRNYQRIKGRRRISLMTNPCIKSETFVTIKFKSIPATFTILDVICQLCGDNIPHIISDI